MSKTPLRNWIEKAKKARRAQRKSPTPTLIERYGEDYFAELGRKRQAQLRGREYEPQEKGVRVWVPGPDIEPLLQWLENNEDTLPQEAAALMQRIKRERKGAVVANEDARDV